MNGEGLKFQFRQQLSRDPAGLYLHELILEACRKFPERTALVDYSSDPPRRLTYAQYGDIVEQLARGLSARCQPGEVVAIFLYNSWEFCAAYHAATLAGCIPTLLNPTYRDREVHHQLDNSGAALLVSDGPQLDGVHLDGLPALRHVFTTRTPASGSEAFARLLEPQPSTAFPALGDPESVLAALPYSSGTTGLPKGVMLSHSNLVTNIFQLLAPGERATYSADEVVLCCLPLYHIYGLNVVLNPLLYVGAKLVLMPRFEQSTFLRLIAEEQPTHMPLVPPLINCLVQAAERGEFPRHSIRYVKSGAAPLAPELARRFTELTGILIRQGYGMTEASPVTHLGFIEPELYRADSIGWPVANTDCRIVSEGQESRHGELVMRGPQFMLGYWNNPGASALVLREGWYWSGDVATVDGDGFYRIVDRVKEMIKYNGFPIAPAEVEAVLLEHPQVRDCGMIGRKHDVAGEIPCAFVVLRDGVRESKKLEEELCAFVAERLTGYKQPREIRFVSSIPRNPSGKILRRSLREQFA